MADIFISYAKEDRSRVEILARALEARGWSIFWDFTIPVGKTWRQVITEALDDAKCAVVVWSSASINSEWVHEEAEEAQERRILVPAMIDRVKPPLGFRRMQAARLFKWAGESNHPEFRKLLDSIEAILSASEFRVEAAGQKPTGEDGYVRSELESAIDTNKTESSEAKSVEPKPHPKAPDDKTVPPPVPPSPPTKRFIVMAVIAMSVVAGVVLYIIGGPEEKTPFEIEPLYERVGELEHAVAESKNREQLAELSSQIDEFSHHIKELFEPANRAGLGSQLEDIQNRLEQIQAAVARKIEALSEFQKSRLFVEIIPEYAHIQILNIDEPFQQGMELAPGRYHLEVNAEGYKTLIRWIELAAGHEQHLRFELEK